MSCVRLLLTVSDGNGAVRFEQRGGRLRKTFRKTQAYDGYAPRPGRLREPFPSRSENPMAPAVPFKLSENELSPSDLRVLASRLEVVRFRAGDCIFRMGSPAEVCYPIEVESSFTPGCGTFGANSTTDNITYRHLLNIKRVARHIESKEQELATAGLLDPCEVTQPRDITTRKLSA